MTKQRHTMVMLGAAIFGCACGGSHAITCPPGSEDRGDGKCHPALQCPDSCPAGMYADTVACACLPILIDAAVADAIVGNCDVPLDCPSPTLANHVSLCGRVYDSETTQPLDDGTQGTAAGVEIRLYDPLLFVNDPSTMPFETGAVDSCGRFALKNVMSPGPFIALAIEDKTGSADDTYVLTGVARPTTTPKIQLNAFVTRHDTDLAWSASAGLAGPTFGARGVYLAIYEDAATPLAPLAGTPVAGVTGTVAGAQDPSGDYYFSDTTPLSRAMVDPAANATNGNGAMLVIGASGLVSFGGMSSSCSFTQVSGATLANVVFVQEFAGHCP